MSDTAIKQLRADYRKQFPHCQYTKAVGRFIRLPEGLGHLELDHIWGKYGKKSEHWSNYAMASHGAHQLWKHHMDVVTSRVAITWYKWRLASATGDSRHFDRDALAELTTGGDVVAWVERKLDTVPWWCRRMGEELVRECV